MSETIDGDALLARLKPTLRVVRQQVCMRPDLMDVWETAEEKLSEAQTVLDLPGRRLSDGGVKKAAGDVKELAQKVKDAEAAAEDASVWFEFQALPVDRYQALLAEHPPRPDDQLDMFAGHNRDAVVDELVRRCLVNPVFSDAGWAEYKSTCRASVWGALRDAANDANGGPVTAPKSLMASQVLSRSDNASV